MIELSGIYKIICKNNNRFYIGSSTNINRRLREHVNLLKQNKHKNKYLQKCWNEYGEKNFRFEIIETIHDINNLLAREQWWLNKTDCCNRKIGFNISSDPCSPGTGRFIDLTGQKFNKLTINKYVGKNKYGKSLWLCMCECGNEYVAIGSGLKNGKTKTCGCDRIKHGHLEGNKQSLTYRSWTSMKSRCNNPNDPSYKDYGKRGITVCSRWLNKKNGFENFFKDMGKRPGKEYSIDRINNNLGYYKENCRWATKKQQGRNTRSNRLILYNDKNQCMSALEEEYNIKHSTLQQRLNNGWSIKRALTIPVRKRGNKNI